MSVVTRLYRGETRVDFIGNRRRWYFASGVLLLICLLSFIFRGFNYGVEFKGGTQFQLPVQGTSITVKEVDTAFTDAGVKPADPPQEVGSGSTRQIVVKTESLLPGKQQELKAKVGQ